MHTVGSLALGKLRASPVSLRKWSKLELNQFGLFSRPGNEVGVSGNWFFSLWRHALRPEELSTQIGLGTSKSVGAILIFGTHFSV